MARDYTEIVKRVEAIYPQARGGANYDDSFRSMLVPWANDLIFEISQMQRWSYEYTSTSFLTTPAQSTYLLDTAVSPSLTAIKFVYYIDSTGQPRPIVRRDRFQAAVMVGDTSVIHAEVVPPGAPVYYSIDNRTMEIFPPPDSAGYDTAGNYLIFVQGYSKIADIVETTSTTDGTTNTIIVPDTAYMTALGAAGPVSIRGAGFLGANSVADTFIDPLINIATGTTYTTTDTPPVAVTDAQTFFNSQNWIITWWPKVMLFGMLREAASYLADSDKYQMWEQRYQAELNLLRASQFDFSRSQDMAAAVTAGQNSPEERRLDSPTAFDVRGAP